MPCSPEAARLVLRDPGPQDEEVLRRAHRDLAREGFGVLFDPGLPWREQLRGWAAERAGEGLPPGRVPADYLVADVDGTVVGRVSVRHELTPWLLEVGGHVGYAVWPGHRRRGYGTAMLRAGLRRLRELGVPRALITCDAENLGSAAVIEACGGVLEDVREVAPGAPAKRRYWIDLTTSG